MSCKQRASGVSRSYAGGTSNNSVNRRLVGPVCQVLVKGNN